MTQRKSRTASVGDIVKIKDGIFKGRTGSVAALRRGESYVISRHKTLGVQDGAWISQGNLETVTDIKITFTVQEIHELSKIMDDAARGDHCSIRKKIMNAFRKINVR